MSKKELTLVSKILLAFTVSGELLEPLINIHELKRRVLTKGLPKRSYDTLYQLQRRGLIKFIDKNNARFVKLTKKGELQALVAKMNMQDKPAQWDGQWRVVVFDIPEESKIHRHNLRSLLKKQGFKLLQASVWINPYPLARAAVEYLKQAKLLPYIRIMKVAEMDDDSELKKIFQLK